MIKEPSNIEMPSERIMPLRYIGFRLMEKGPFVTNLVGFVLKSIGVLFLFNAIIAQISRAIPRKIMMNPKKV